MATKDLYHNVAIATLLGMSSVSADKSSNILDSAGIRSIVLQVVGTASGIGEGEKISFVVKHGDNKTSMSNVSEDDLLGSLEDVEANGDFIRTCGYCGSKRYVQVFIDITGTLSATMGVYAIVDHAYRAPVSSPTVIAIS